jgi:hypothetical protein
MIYLRDGIISRPFREPFGPTFSKCLTSRKNVASANCRPGTRGYVCIQVKEEVNNSKVGTVPGADAPTLLQSYFIAAIA